MLRGVAVRTPLVRLDADTDAEIWLKLENLQPIGSFKIRGAYNAMRSAAGPALDRGVFTVSAGNMAQGVAYAARELDVAATILVPEHAPATKLDAIARLGGRVVRVPYDEWWEAITTGETDRAEGLLVHPVWDEPVMAGNGTIGLEILEDLPDPDLVLVPWGGGGLFTGIASAVKALRPETRMGVVEPQGGAPVFATRAAGGEPKATDYEPTLVDGAGARGLLPRVWERAHGLIDESYEVRLDDVAAAIRVLAERARVVAEGAGALAPATALSGHAGADKIVCVVSGGNIGAEMLAAILRGETPR